MSKRGRSAAPRGPRIGPATTVALVICGVLVALGRATRRPHYLGEHAWRERPASHAAASVPVAPEPPPLIKPDPGYVLARADILKLTPAQRKAVTAADAAWCTERERLTQAMETAAAPARTERAASAEEVAGKLGGYSDLSREFDARRRQAWDEARRALTPEQIRALDATLPEGGAK